MLVPSSKGEAQRWYRTRGAGTGLGVYVRSCNDSDGGHESEGQSQAISTVSGSHSPHLCPQLTGSHRMVLGPAASASLGILLEMQILGLSGSLCFQQSAF